MENYTPEELETSDAQLDADQIQADVDTIFAEQKPVSTFADESQLTNFAIDGNKFSLTDNSGGRFYVDRANLEDALSNPENKLETREQHDYQRGLEQDALDFEYYATGPRATYAKAMGLLNATTGGLSEIGYGLIGDEKNLQEYSKIRGANPLATGLGELGAILNPVGPMGRGVRSINLISKGIYKKLASEITETGFKNFMTKAALRTGSYGATGFGEHLLLQSKQFFTEGMAGNIDMNAENLFAMYKQGSGYAFLIGGGLGVGRSVYKGIAGKVAKALNKGDDAANMDLLFGTNPSKNLDRQQAKGMIGNRAIVAELKASGKDVEVDKVFLKRAIKNELDNARSFKDDVLKKVDDVSNEIDDIGTAANIKENLEFVTGELNYNKYPQAGKLIDKMMDELDNIAINKVEGQGSLLTLSKWVDDIPKRLEKVGFKAGSKEFDNSFKPFLDSVKSEMAERIGKVESGGRVLSYLDQDIDILEEFSRGLKGEIPAIVKNAKPVQDIIADVASAGITDMVLGDGFGDPLQFVGGFLLRRGGKYALNIFKNSMKEQAKRLYLVHRQQEITKTLLKDTAKKATSKLKIGGGSASANFLRSSVFDELPENATNEDKIEHMTTKIDEYANKPEMLQERTAASVKNYTKSMPLMAEGVMDRNVKLVEFLNNKIPRNPQSGAAQIQNRFSKRKWRPSKQQIRTFEKYLSGAVAPETVLEDISNGRVSQEQMEAFRTFYPEMYKQLTFDIVEQVATSDTPVPYNKRLKLSLVLGVPLDTSLEPQNIRNLQALNEPTPEEQPQAAPPKGNFDKLTVGDRALSDLDKSLNRR